jgi:hypothetical protein
MHSIRRNRCFPDLFHLVWIKLFVLAQCTHFDIFNLARRAACQRMRFGVRQYVRSSTFCRLERGIQYLLSFWCTISIVDGHPANLDLILHPLPGRTVASAHVCCYHLSTDALRSYEMICDIDDSIGLIRGPSTAVPFASRPSNLQLAKGLVGLKTAQ